MTPSLRPATLHSALDAYSEHVIRTSVCAAIYHRRWLVRRIRESHDNIPLAQLDYGACAEMIDFWCQRPQIVSTGKPIARKTAQKYLLELTHFFRWLSLSCQFPWKMPADLEQAPRQIKRLVSDRPILRREEFTVEHLSVLYQRATPVQRLMLCLALNCGMGAAEMGRLKREDFIFDSSDEFVFDVSPGEAMVRFVRPTTGAYYEWLLWPETVEAVKWAIARAGELGSELIFVSDDGRPMRMRQTANPSCAFRRQWRQLLDSVEKHGVPSLSLGTLRKQMAEQLRRERGNDISRLFLGHVPTAGDQLLWMQRPFRQLHEALRQLRTSLASIFESPDA